MVLGLLCRVGSDGIITSTDNVDDGENYEDDVGTLAHRHTGTLAHWHTGTGTLLVESCHGQPVNTIPI